MVSTVGPLDTCHCVILPKVVEFSDLARSCWPEVHARAKADCKHIWGRPVHKVQIEIILEGRGIKDLKRYFWDLPLLLVGGCQKLFLIETCERRNIECRTLSKGISLLICIGESQYIVRRRRCQTKRDGSFDASEWIHEVIIQGPSMYEMRILYTQDLVLEKSRVHPLILISLLTEVCLVHLILLVTCTVWGEWVLIPITSDWHHHKVSLSRWILTLRISANELIMLIYLGRLRKYLGLRIVIVVELACPASLWNEAIPSCMRGLLPRGALAAPLLCTCCTISWLWMMLKDSSFHGDLLS